LIFAALVWQSRRETSIKKWNGEVARVAALVAGAGVRSKTDESAVRATFLERGDSAEPRPFIFSPSLRVSGSGGGVFGFSFTPGLVIMGIL
jgi:hypothetical protein